MTKTQRKVAAMMLKMAAEHFSNHTCNDFELPATSEMLEFMKGMIAASDYPDDELPLYFGTILTLDWKVMKYCQELLEKEND